MKMREIHKNISVICYKPEFNAFKSIQYSKSYDFQTPRLFCDATGRIVGQYHI